MIDTFHFRKSQLNEAVSHGVLAEQGPHGPFSRTSSGRRRPISPRAGERHRAPCPPGCPSLLFIHVTSRRGLPLHGPHYPHTSSPSTGAVTWAPSEDGGDDGQTWKGQAGREVARPQGGPAAPLEGASGGLGVLSASFYQVIFFKLLKRELTTSPGNC